MWAEAGRRRVGARNLQGGSGRGVPPDSNGPSRLRASNSVLPVLPVQFSQQTQSIFGVAPRDGGEKPRFGLILRDNHVRPGIEHLIDALAAAAGNLPDPLQLVVSAPANQQLGRFHRAVFGFHDK